MEQSESRRSGTPTDTALTKDTEGGVTTIHYGNYIHYCRITDTTQCSGVVTEHMLVYVCSGELLVTERGRSHALRRGDAYILRRNHMCRKTSRSLPDGEPFEGLFFYLTVPMLRRTLTQNAISGSAACCRRPRRHTYPCRAMRSSTTSSLRSPRTSSRSAFPARGSWS